MKNMIFLKKKRDNTLDVLIEKVKLIDMKMSKVETEVDLINLKLRKKLYSDGLDKPTKTRPSGNETIKYQDGFDEIRNLYGDNNT